MYSHSEVVHPCETAAASVQTREMCFDGLSFLRYFVYLCSVSSQVSSSNWRAHNLGYCTNLKQIIPLISVETRRLKYSLEQLPVSIAATLPAERTRVLLHAGSSQPSGQLTNNDLCVESRLRISGASLPLPSCISITCSGTTIPSLYCLTKAPFGTIFME
jgi:hypothetical protein